MSLAILNRGYETNTDSWSANAAGTTLSRDTTDPLFGAGCLLVECSGSGSFQGVAQGSSVNNMAASPSTQHTLSVYAKGSGTVSLRISSRNGSTNLTNHQSGSLSIPAEWGRLTFTFTTHASADNLRDVRLFTPSSQDVDFRIDGWQLDVGGSALTYDGPDASSPGEYEEGIDDSITAADSIKVEWAAARSVDDGLAASDLVARQWVIARSVQDDVTAADVTATTWDASRTVEDQVQAEDDASPDASYARSVDDALTAVDDRAGEWAASRAVEDDVEATDDVAQQASFARDVSDGLGAADDVQITEAGQHRQLVDDDISATDETGAAWTAHLAIDEGLDGLAATDNLSTAVSLRVEDGAALDDDAQTDSAATLKLTLNDDLEASDDFARTWVASLHALEVMQALDSMVAGFGSRPAIVDLRELATTTAGLTAAATTSVRLQETATTTIQLTEEPR